MTNLSGTPYVDTWTTTATRSTIAVTSNGYIWAVGRNGAANTAAQQYDSNLSPVGGLQNLTPGIGKPGAPAAAWADQYNVVHTASWAILAGGSGVCADRCGMVYNRQHRPLEPSYRTPRRTRGHRSGRNRTYRMVE
ncbi:MAG: hypothetical protein Q7T82_20940 [Armatimonadota bacterium]|nr:hypothetical protein [Armatimonadota bacterium]